MPPRLSKSRFVIGHQCHRRLWWETHDREAPELTRNAADQAILDHGRHVGEVAQQYIPGGVLIDAPYTEPRRRVTETRAALDADARRHLRGAFLEDDIFVAVDILHRNRSGWTLTEVKSTTQREARASPRRRSANPCASARWSPRPKRRDHAPRPRLHLPGPLEPLLAARRDRGSRGAAADDPARGQATAQDAPGPASRRSSRRQQLLRPVRVPVPRSLLGTRARTSRRDALPHPHERRPRSWSTTATRRLTSCPTRWS